MTEFVEHWVDGKLKLIPKGKSPAAATNKQPAHVPSGPDPRAQHAVENVCGPVETRAGNVVGAPNIGVEERSARNPWVDAVYGGVQRVKRLFERADARNTTDLL